MQLVSHKPKMLTCAWTGIKRESVRETPMQLLSAFPWLSLSSALAWILMTASERSLKLVICVMKCRHPGLTGNSRLTMTWQAQLVIDLKVSTIMMELCKPKRSKVLAELTFKLLRATSWRWSLIQRLENSMEISWSTLTLRKTQLSMFMPMTKTKKPPGIQTGMTSRSSGTVTQDQPPRSRSPMVTIPLISMYQITAAMDKISSSRLPLRRVMKSIWFSEQSLASLSLINIKLECMNTSKIL